LRANVRPVVNTNSTFQRSNSLENTAIIASGWVGNVLQMY